jgi:hypothetical protein
MGGEMKRTKGETTKMEFLDIRRIGDWKKLEEIGRKMAGKKRRGRYIKCWKCGEVGLVSIEKMGRKLVMRCYHIEKGKRRRCYLGLVEKLFIFMLEEGGEEK